MVLFRQAIAGIVRQLTSGGYASPHGQSSHAQMLAGLNVAAAALDNVPVTRSFTSGKEINRCLCTSIGGGGSAIDPQNVAGIRLAAEIKLEGRRGFATGKFDKDADEKMRTIKQLLADLNLTSVDVKEDAADPPASDRSAKQSGSSSKEIGTAHKERKKTSHKTRSIQSARSSSDSSDSTSSSSSSSSDSDSDDDSRKMSSDEQIWNAKMSEWTEKADPNQTQPRKFSKLMYREDGTRIDEDSPLKVEEFLPPPHNIPSIMSEVHGLLPPGQRSMESMMTKMELEGVEGLPPLEEILALPEWEKAEAKRLAREKEMKKQQEQAAARVRTVDEFGRSHAVGKRKCSIARIWLQEGQGQITVNGRPHVDYFAEMDHRMSVLQPFFQTSTLGTFDVKCLVNGGGLSGQSQAIRHGISKALQLFDPEMRPPLRSAGLLTRDPRVVERKKPGKAKARKSFQWVKR